MPLQETLIILAEGCPRHPPYRGRNPPTNDCPACAQVWDARQKLDHPEPSATVPYDPECMLCQSQTTHGLLEHWMSKYETVRRLYAQSAQQ